MVFLVLMLYVNTVHFILLELYKIMYYCKIGLFSVFSDTLLQEPSVDRTFIIGPS